MVVCALTSGQKAREAVAEERSRLPLFILWRCALTTIPIPSPIEGEGLSCYIPPTGRTSMVP
jgi:hypothetical protein